MKRNWQLAVFCGFVAAVLTAGAAEASAAANAARATTGKTATTSEQMSWAPETLSGKISMIDPNRGLLIVQDSDGVPFDMVVTSKTHITSGEHNITLKDLEQYQNKSVSVHYKPERRGDVAESVRISG